MSNWGLPTQVVISGRTYEIHTDYRDILRIFSELENPDHKPYEQLYIAQNLFYEDFASIPEECHSEAARQMNCFIDLGQPDDGTKPIRLLDWEQDQQMIAADINKVAGTEIRALPYLHWWTFVAYFSAIGSGQLSTVIAIRDKLRRGKKLENWERDFYQRNRKKVQLQPKYSAEEQAEIDRLNKILGGG